MKVCFFGGYAKRDFNLLLKKILELQDLEIIECHEDVNGILSFLCAYPKLFFKHRKLNYDVMISPWRGITTLPLAKLITKKPIVHFAFISIYDTLVNDRKTIKRNSITAKIIHFIDKLACNIANLVILDSYGEIQYFVQEFNLEKEKFKRLNLSADEDKFPPMDVKTTSSPFVVLYFGSFIPLHGVEVIINAAKILSDQDIIFRFCGDGQTKTKMQDLTKKYNLDNVEFLGFVEQSVLSKNIQNSDICFGIFGKGEKAMKVITNKIFQILASQRTLVTMDSNGIKEIFLKHDENCILVPQDDAEALAESILYLKNNPSKNIEIAKNGYDLFVFDAGAYNIKLHNIETGQIGEHDYFNRE